MFFEAYKNRYITFNKPVRVYRNLHRKGVVYSIQQNGLVVGHASDILLKDVSFIVKESGRQKVLDTKQKNIHAFVEGKLRGFDHDDLAFLDFSSFENVRYNPYKFASFVDSQENPIYNTKYAMIGTDGIIHGQELIVLEEGV